MRGRSPIDGFPIGRFVASQPGATQQKRPPGLNRSRFTQDVGLHSLISEQENWVLFNNSGLTNIAPGHFIATKGETGYQATVIPPGTFRISIFFNVINRVDLLPVVVVPNGFYGRVVANDGEKLSAGQIMADAWPDAEQTKFLDAKYFMSNGGRKGLQLSVLKPGIYPLNLALFQIKIGYFRNGRDITANTDDVYDLRRKTTETTPLDTSITRVPARFISVVRSSVQEAGVDCKVRTAQTDSGGRAAELVTQHCKGIWDTSLPPNDYHLNRDAYDVTLVSTRVTTLEFKGGFTRRYIDLKVDAKGDFTQADRTASFPQPNDAADRGLGNSSGTACDRPNHAGKCPDPCRRSGRPTRGRSTHCCAVHQLVSSQYKWWLDYRTRTKRQRCRR
jgi:hypothetical protein